MPFSSKMASSDIFLRRKPDTHKSDYGHIFVIAGSLGLTGAAVLCANSAMRAGAGLVSLGCPESLYSIIARKTYPEVMVRPLAETKERTLSLKAYPSIMALAQKADVLAAGPGMSRNIRTQRLILRIVRDIRKPLVLDADALNAICGHLDLLRLRVGDRRQYPVLTPHPGEFSRLTGRSVVYIRKNRENLAKSFASRYNTVLVLKGHHTVVASPQGKLYVNKTGGPGMATAGCGDVLTGIIAALLGQGLENFEAAKLGVYLHGAAGDLAANEKTQAGMLASDIIEKIPEAIKKYC